MKFEEGEKAKIVQCTEGHRFRIGEQVTIKRVTEVDYLAENTLHQTWWVTDEEVGPIKDIDPEENPQELVCNNLVSEAEGIE